MTIDLPMLPLALLLLLTQPAGAAPPPPMSRFAHDALAGATLLQEGRPGGCEYLWRAARLRGEAGSDGIERLAMDAFRANAPRCGIRP